MTDGSGKSRTSEKSAQSAQSGKSGKSDKSGKSGKSDKSGKSTGSRDLGIKYIDIDSGSVNDEDKHQFSTPFANKNLVKEERVQERVHKEEEGRQEEGSDHDDRKKLNDWDSRSDTSNYFVSEDDEYDTYSSESASGTDSGTVSESGSFSERSGSYDSYDSYDTIDSSDSSFDTDNFNGGLSSSGSATEMDKDSESEGTEDYISLSGSENASGSETSEHASKNETMEVPINMMTQILSLKRKEDRHLDKKRKS